MTIQEKKYKWRRADYQEKTRGLLIVHTGNGKGKTTCALGLMMRAAGQGLRCCMVQFMKSRNDRYGEVKSAATAMRNSLSYLYHHQRWKWRQTGRPTTNSR